MTQSRFPRAQACALTLGFTFGLPAAQAQVLVGTLDYTPILSVPAISSAALAALTLAIGSIVAFRVRRREGGRAMRFLTLLSGTLLVGALGSAGFGASQLLAGPAGMTERDGGSYQVYSCSDQDVANSSGVKQSIARVAAGSGYAQQTTAAPACSAGAAVASGQSCSLKLTEYTPVQAGAATWVQMVTDQSIGDVTTGNPVTDPTLMANLQSALYLPMVSTPMATDQTYGCTIEVDMPAVNYPPNGDLGAVSCWTAEFLFSEISACPTASGQRTFLADAPTFGVTGARVDPLAQLGAKNVFYPGAYAASGLADSGNYNAQTGRWEGTAVFRTRLSGKNGTYQSAAPNSNPVALSGNPIIQGFRFTPLAGCVVKRTGFPDGTSAPGTAFAVDLGTSSSLPPNVRIVNCGVSLPSAL